MGLRVFVIVCMVMVVAGEVASADGIRGEREYIRYCSACHGETADGKGPVANVLTPRPPSLRRLGAKFERPLATALVTYVMGETMPRAHGTSDMPVWGRNLIKDEEGNDDQSAQTIWLIVDFLESIQSES